MQDEEKEIEDREDSESSGSTTKSHLKELLELASPSVPKSTPVAVTAAREVLASWVLKPFDVVQSFTTMEAVYHAIVVMSRAYPNWREYLALASNQVIELRYTLSQYHASVDLETSSDLAIW